MELEQYIGNKIKYYRKRLNLTQTQLGKKIGVGKTTISNYEAGYRTPKQDELFNLAQVFDISINDLFPETKRDPKNLLLVPIAGKVAAGKPNYAVEDVLGYMTLPPDKKSNEGLMYLEVDSDSMDKQFPIGSYVLVDTTTDIENGNVAVVKVNGNEATLKQVKFDESKETMFLIPNSHNENYNPVVVNGEDDEVTLVGKVVGMYQSL